MSRLVIAALALTVVVGSSSARSVKDLHDIDKVALQQAGTEMCDYHNTVEARRWLSKVSKLLAVQMRVPEKVANARLGLRLRVARFALKKTHERLGDVGKTAVCDSLYQFYFGSKT